MAVTSFSTADTICVLIIAASSWLFASAVRHHSTWTPIALTMIDARTRPEIARQMPIRMNVGALLSTGPAIFAPHFMVGMTNSAPSLMPEGQRDVTVLVLV